MTNSRSIGYIFAAALALAAVGNAQVDEVTTDEASFAEAVAFVQSFSSETGDGGSACAKVANDSIKVIADECADVQKDLDALAGSTKGCCTSGETSLCAAKIGHLSAKGKGDKCRAEAAAIENQTVDLGKVSLKTLNQATDQCFNFQNVGGYKTLKEKHTSKIKACLVAKGKTEGLKTFLDAAVKDAAIARTECVTSLSTKLDEAYTSGASKCGSEANKVAYKRAEHMKCVLAGTKLADCKLDKMPTVTKPTPATLVCKPSSASTSFCTPPGLKILDPFCNSYRCDGQVTSPVSGQVMSKAISGKSSCKYGGHAGLFVTWPCSQGRAALYGMKGDTMGGKNWRDYDFKCPKGWHWAKADEWVGLIKRYKSSACYRRDPLLGPLTHGNYKVTNYVGSGMCGYSGHNAQYIGGGKEQQLFWVFSDTAKTNPHPFQYSGNSWGSKVVAKDSSHIWSNVLGQGKQLAGIACALD